MAKLIHSSAKLIPYHQPNAVLPSFVFVFSHKPRAQEAHLGSLYIVAEVMAKESKAKEFCELLSRHFIDDYYSNSKKQTTASTFEDSINSINRYLRNLSEEYEGLANNFNGVICIVSGTKLELAQAGLVSALLLRKDSLHSVFSIQDKTSSNSDQTKVFESIAEGELIDGDSIIIGTAALLFSFDKSDIKSVLTNSTPNDVIKKLHSMLAEDKNAYRCGAVVISSTDEVFAVHQPVNSPIESELHTGHKTTLLQKTQNKVEPIAKIISAKALNMAKSTGKWAHNQLWPKLSKTSKQWWNTLWTKYINKNPRLAAVISIALLIVIISSIFFVLKPARNVSAGYESYKQANLDYLSAQSRFSDGKKDEAYELTQKSQATLTNIEPNAYKSIEKRAQSDKSLPEKFTIEQLKQKIISLTDKITSTTRFNPIAMADLSTKGEVKNLALIETKLFCLNSGGTIFSLDINSNSVEENTTKIPGAKVLASTTDNTRRIVYYLTDEPGVWKFNTQTKSAESVQLSSGQWTNAVDIAFYNDSLYLLSPSTKQVVRYGPTSIGFGFGNSYFKKTNSDPANFTSLAINGNIILSNKNGDLGLFRLGEQLNFSSQNKPPDIEGVNKLQINTKNSQLTGASYNKSRVYLFSLTTNEAAFIRQYAPPSEQKISAFAASTDLTKFYVAIDGKISKFE